MTKLIIIFLLVSCSLARAEDITVSIHPYELPAYVPTTTPQRVVVGSPAATADVIPPEHAFDSCSQLPRVSGLSVDRGYYLPGFAWRVLVQPTDANGVAQDYSDRGFWADFMPDDASIPVSLNVVVVAAPGQLDVNLAAPEMAKLSGRKGSLFLRVLNVQAYATTMVTAIYIPLQPSFIVGAP